METQSILENSEDPKKIQFESLNICEMYPMILILNLLCRNNPFLTYVKLRASMRHASRPDRCSKV